MARPNKQGLDYFSLDADFFSNKKIRRLRRSCGSKAILVLIRLYCSIYQDEGYYLHVDDDLLFEVSEDTGTEEETVMEIINKTLDLGFFDKSLFSKYGILTSFCIQDHYRHACKRRKEFTIIPEYCLLEDQEEVIVDMNSENTVNNEHIDIDKDRNKDKIKNIPPTPPGDLCHNNFKTHYSWAKQGYESLREDKAYLSERKKFHPYVDIGPSTQAAGP